MKNKQTTNQSLAISALSIACASMLSSTALSVPSGPRKLQNYLQEKAGITLDSRPSCATCHQVGLPVFNRARNPFGEDVGRRIRGSSLDLSDIIKTDSDGDKVSNEQEFIDGTNPGDPNSFLASSVPGE